jgi:PAS domain S-box-containing protein
MSGFDKDEMIGIHAASLIVEDKEMRKNIREKIAELYEKGSATYEAAYKTKDGKSVDVECTSSMIKTNEEGDYIAGVSILRNITGRKKAEREIREARDFLKSVIEGSRDGILITDERGYITSLNTANEKMTKFKKEEVIGKHSSIFLSEDEETRKNIRVIIAGLFEKGFASYETKQKTKDGRIINVECNCSMIRDDKGDYIAGVSIIRDITERKKMEQQLLQSEKLKSLGELAGGVAHDFNNVLAAILGRVQLLKMQLKPPLGKQEKRKSLLELKKSLEIIERASLDGAETVRRIQEFSRRSVDDKVFTQVSINELIDDALEFTRVRWKNEAESKGIKIRIKKELSPLAPALGSPSELREVFTNLINNAIDVMPQGGEIRVKSFMDDNIVVIRIVDTGNGIPKDIKDRIFDPFFTTKGVPSTGLGLSVSYGIINRHRGTITVDSVEGEETTFTIKFPITKKTGKGEVKEEKVIPIKRKQKKARILVIEDEEDIRQLLRDILTDAGHKVEVANDGSEGIEIFKKKKFDLVFTDLGMPVMSGWEVTEKIKSINDKVPVALITGWNVKLDESEMNDSRINLVVQKPFKMEQILNLVQEGMLLRDRFKAV